MSKNNLFTCLRFEENLIYIAVIDPDSAEVKRSDPLKLNFPVMNSSGILTEPERLAELLKKQISAHKLPQTIKISIGLKYVDIKQFDLPTMPENELEPVITDEAIRESIFSFSGGKIGIAYAVLRDVPQRLKSELKMNIIATTIPHEVIDGLVAMSKAAALKLIAIQPDLAGFRQLLHHGKPKQNGNTLLLRVTSTDAELFLWEESYPVFWRYLSVGSDQPERLRHEIETTLEHIESKTGQSLSSSKILVAGPMIPGLAEHGLKPEAMPHGEWSDLLGVGLLSAHRNDLNFLKAAPTGPDYSVQLPHSVYWITLAGLLLVNGWNGWNLKEQWLSYQSIVQKNNTLEQALVKKENQLQLLQHHGISKSDRQIYRNMPAWLEKLRALTPTDIRFESIEYQRDNHAVIMMGVSLSAASLERFLDIIATMDDIKSIDEFQSAEQNHPGLNLKSFHVKATLEESKS